MLEYGLALGVAMALAVWSGRREIAMSAIVIAGVWAAWCLFIMATGDYEPWYWGIIIDGAAIRVLLHSPSCRVRATLASLFVMQIAAHVAYGAVLISMGAADWQSYYIQTQLTGWAQLLVIGGWGGGVVLRRIVRDWRSGHARRYQAHHRDMGAGA